MTSLLEVMDHLIEAQYSRSARRPALQRANVALERARYLLRLSKDLNCLSLREYELACGHVLTVGRMVGGWLRQQSPQSPQSQPSPPLSAQAVPSDAR